MNQNFQYRKIPRLRGGWNVGPDEYKSMGYFPGLPPSIIPKNSKNVRLLSNLFEASGVNNDYLQTPSENEYINKTLFIYNFPKDFPLEKLINFIYTSLTSRGLYSSPGIYPKAYRENDDSIVAVSFPEEEDAFNMLKINNEITFLNNHLDIRPLYKNTETEIPPLMIFNDNPQRLMITNVNIEHINELPSFISQFFNIDSFYSCEHMKDCCFVDVTPPISPETAALKLNNKDFYGFELQAYSMRSYKDNINDDDNIASKNSKFNVLIEDLDLHSILQLKTKITTKTDSVGFTGKYLHILNCVPLKFINDEKQINQIAFDIVNECSKYGKVKNCHFSNDENIGAVGGYAVAIIEFEDDESASIAQKNLSGRKYLGRSVITIVCD